MFLDIRPTFPQCQLKWHSLTSVAPDVSIAASSKQLYSLISLTVHSKIPSTQRWEVMRYGLFVNITLYDRKPKEQNLSRWNRKGKCTQPKCWIQAEIWQNTGKKISFLYCFIITHVFRGILNNQKELKAWFCNVVWQLATGICSTQDLYISHKTLFNTDLGDISVCWVSPTSCQQRLQYKNPHVLSSYLRKQPKLSGNRG